VAIRTTDAEGNPAEMPWLQYWQGLAVAGDALERVQAEGVRRMRIWNYDVAPQAAEMILHWIARGHWDMGASA